MRKYFLLAVFAATSTFSLAQDDASIPDPEFVNQVYVVNKDKQLQKLEKVSAETKTKSKGLGMAGAKQMYIINGSSSDIKVAPGLMFVVSTGSSGFGSDPTSQFALYKFETKKNNREALIGNYGGMGKNKKEENPTEIVLNFKKVKEGVFGIVPEKELDKGEYAFINKMSVQTSGMSIKNDGFAFSIE